MSWEIDDALLARLRKGEIVVRGVERQKGHNHLRAEAVGLLRTNRTNLVSFLTDFNRYPQYFPEVKKCELLAQTAEGYMLGMRLSVLMILPTFEYKLRMEVRDDEIYYEQVSGDFEILEGAWRFKQISDKELALGYSNYVALKGIMKLVPEFVKDTILKLTYPGAVRNLGKGLQREGLLLH